ncbi:MAG: molybdate ABC transporter substrate-binding protein, partial [Syntrophobacteraceae bacterium]|nr:molybdate ABC transporter substrate-binding protein [Syntrophobacteraceae bacterium]
MKVRAVVWWMLWCAVPMSLLNPIRAHAEQELIVSAAASLTNAFQEVARKFEEANPGVKVVPNFAASGPLLQQIEKGAPVDVFASADQKTMDQAGEKKLILPETRKDFVSNRLVLIVPQDSKLPIKSLSFQHADIRSVVNHLADYGQVNIVVSPTVDAVVSL